MRGGPDYEKSPLLTEQCHRQDKPIVVTAIGNQMSVYFRSDWYFRGKGFLASFTTLPQGAPSSNQNLLITSLPISITNEISIHPFIDGIGNVAGCGGLFKAPSGVIQSPNYPENYDRSSDCGWLIEVLANHVVELTIEDFAVVSRTNCSSDYLAVSDTFFNNY